MPGSPRKRVLLVAFHFPPDGGSGMQRTLKFARYLPELGWDVEVLTVRESTYDVFDHSMLEQVPKQVAVHRTFCLHPVKHLSIAGRYPGIFDFLDRFAYWFPFGVWRGWRLLRQRRFDVIYSTSPTRTAHLIAGALARWTGIPWACDFRDPWLDPVTEERLGRTRGGRIRLRFLHWLERNILRGANRVIANTAQAGRDIAQCHPELDPIRIAVLPNGYDEEDFTGITSDAKAAPSECLVLLHSGEVYPEIRDPRPLIEAAQSLVASGKLGAAEVQFRFIGAGFVLETGEFPAWLKERSLERMVSLEPRMAHRECVAAMLSADALLLMQSTRSTNRQVPAKFYEYLRTGRPVLTMAPADSATAQIARDCGAGWEVEAGDPEGLRAALLEMIELHRACQLNSKCQHCEKFERRQLTVRFAEILEQCSRSAPRAAQESAATVSSDARAGRHDQTVFSGGGKHADD